MAQLKDEVIEGQISKNEKEAERIVNDPDKLEEFLVKLEAKLTEIPLAGNALSAVPTMVSMVRAYAKKEYTEPPVGTIVAIVAALLYVLSPVDLIPDAIPGIGYLDDAAVVAFYMERELLSYRLERTERDISIFVLFL